MVGPLWFNQSPKKIKQKNNGGKDIKFLEPPLGKF